MRGEVATLLIESLAEYTFQQLEVVGGNDMYIYTRIRLIYLIKVTVKFRHSFKKK